MTFSRPTLQTLINRAVSDLETRITGLDARLSRSFENAVAHMAAGLTHGLYGHQFFLSRSTLPDSTEDDVIRRWAGILGLTPTDPAFAEGDVTFTGTPTTVIPSGTEWQRADGALFATTTALTVDGLGSITGNVKAVIAGADGNTSVSSPLTIVSPIAGVDKSATVAGSGIVGGADAETTTALQARVLSRLRTPPSGGGPGDYVNWSLEVSGVTRAWQYPNENGLGTVIVRFVLDNEVDIIPSSAKVDEVQAYLDARAPVTADVQVVAPVAVDLDPAITLTPNTAAVQAAVTAELEAYLLRVSEPGVTLLWSQINEAISLAPGETDHVLTSPAADKTHTANQIPVLGTPVYS